MIAMEYYCCNFYERRGNVKEDIEKMKQMEKHQVDNKDQKMTTNMGLKISNTDDSLKAGLRGPTLLEDFHFREKITHFDHERIPERVVHARGFGAHGFFQVYESMTEYTKAKFLQDPNIKTPVFVRFSTVVGSRGSADTVRDVRGFATKFYTEEGNFDIVGNNIPVFFIQDAIKFPDVIHAVKPEPNNEIPQATSAHDTFWDFVVSSVRTRNFSEKNFFSSFIVPRAVWWAGGVVCPPAITHVIARLRLPSLFFGAPPKPPSKFF